MGTTNAVMPACRSALGSVRASSKPISAQWASVLQIFWPVTMNASPSGSARVRNEARSLPASGSLKSWHQTCSPLRIFGRSSRFCASVPDAMIACAASMTWSRGRYAPARISSSITTRSCHGP